MRKLVRGLGNWVDGDRFYNRSHELARFVELINEEANILLIAQRRVGKTSLLHEVISRLEDKYICLYLDLEDAKSPMDMVAHLAAATRPHKKLWKKILSTSESILRSVPDTIEIVEISEIRLRFREGLLAADWQSKANRFLEELAQAKKPVVILCDELPILVNRILKGSDFKITPERRENTEIFLSWLRSAAIKHKGRVQFVLAGSIGLNTVVAQAGLSATINLYTPFELPPWNTDTALGCLQALGNSYSVAFLEGARERMVELLGCAIPHHVQLFFDYIYEDLKRRGSLECKVEDVERVYDKSMLGVRGHAELRHMEERLRMVLGQEQLPLALELLTEAAVAEHLDEKAIQIISGGYCFKEKSSKEAIREILSVFEHDGYLEFSYECYRFIPGLLRDWWKRRFSFGYTPVSKRGE